MGKKRSLDSAESENDSIIDSVSKLNSYKSKPLPPGYVCNACGAIDSHAIYNCPLKISKKAKSKASHELKEESDNEVNHVAESSVEQEKDRDAYKKAVYISGLPFSYTKEQVLQLIKKVDDSQCEITPWDIILLFFEDSPTKKSKGMGYINCRNEDDFHRCLLLNGQQVGDRTVRVVESGLALKPTSNSVERLKNNKGPDSKNTGGKPKGCYRCGKLHDPQTCTNPRICYRCKSTEHISTQCPHKKN